MKKQKTQQLLDIEFDFSMFQHIDPYHISTWEQVILLCAANGENPTFDMYKYFLLGSFFSRSINTMLQNAIRCTNYLDEFINSIDGAETTYAISRNASNLSLVSLYNYNCTCRWEYSRIWYDFNDKFAVQPDDDIFVVDTADDAVQSQYAMFKAMKLNLLKLVDLKFPLLWLKLFSKWKHYLKDELKDEDFMRFIIERTRKKADASSYFKPLYNQLLNEFADIRNVQMHLQ